MGQKIKILTKKYHLYSDIQMAISFLLFLLWYE